MGGKDVRITLELDTSNTWVIAGRETEELLKHQQGHWDVYVLKAEDMDRKLQGLAASTLKAEFDTLDKKYDQIDKQYDRETEHSRAVALSKRSGTASWKPRSAITRSISQQFVILDVLVVSLASAVASPAGRAAHVER